MSNRYKGIKTRSPVQEKTVQHSLAGLGVAGWVGLTLLAFMAGAFFGILDVRFGGM